MKPFDCPGVEVSLPRLAYIGQVPVCNISAGPALLYRFARNLPARPVCSSPNRPRTNLRRPINLRAVSHLSFSAVARPLAQFPTKPALWFVGLFPGRPPCPPSLAGAACLWRRSHPGHRATVTPGGLQRRQARSLGVPLHLVVHDHWRECCNVLPWFDRRAEKRLRRNLSCRCLPPDSLARHGGLLP